MLIGHGNIEIYLQHVLLHDLIRKNLPGESIMEIGNPSKDNEILRNERVILGMIFLLLLPILK